MTDDPEPDTSLERLNQILEERAYLAAIVESSDDAIVSKDLNGIVRSWNAAAERMFGYNAAELVGKPIRLIIPADRQFEEDDILERLRRGERIEHFHTVRCAKDGRQLDVSLTVSPVRDSSGRVVGASKIVRDITEQRQSAAERDRLLEAERIARAEAERASRLKDDFVAMVSHELRTPLNAILGWTQLMTRPHADAAVIARGLEVIARNTRLQAQLISDLLDISRIVAGKLPIETRNVDLRAIVGDAVETIEAEARAKGVEIVRALDDGAALVVGDASRLQQIVWNLLSNAIKFTPRGGRIQVRLRFLRDRRPASRSSTPASASGRNPCRTCSTAFIRPTARSRAGSEGWGWAWRSSSTSWSCTVATCRRPAPAKGRAPRSP